MSTQADVLKMSCCPLNFGFTPPQQTKKPQNDTNLRVTDCPTTKNITGYCCLPNSFIVDNSLRIHPPFPRSLFLFCFFQSYASHFHLNQVGQKQQSTRKDDCFCYSCNFLFVVVKENKYREYKKLYMHYI